MKIKGKSIQVPDPVTVTLTRQSGDIEFKCATVVDYSEFKELYPVPEPPIITMVGGKQVSDPQDEDYLKLLQERSECEQYWMFWKSLQATEGLEFESIDPKDPKTFKNLEAELAECLTPFEVARIINGIIEANVPSDKTFDKALESFRATGQEEPVS